MAYNWAQLAFVEKWRLNAVRGPLIGMYRPEDRTFFDVRLRPSEGGAGQMRGPIEIHMVDAGDLIREKRLVLTSAITVVVRLVPSEVAPVDGPGAAFLTPPTGRPRRWLEPDSHVAGTVLRQEDDALLLDVGIPVVVQLPEDGERLSIEPGQTVRLTVAETAKGFLVI